MLLKKYLSLFKGVEIIEKFIDNMKQKKENKKMKISKVEHTRTAVIKYTKQPPKISGVLYYNPEKYEKGKKFNLTSRVERRVKKLNESAQKLYSILNMDKKYEFIEYGKRDEQNFCKIASNNFKELIQSLAKLDTAEEQINENDVENVDKIDPDIIKAQINFLKELPNQKIRNAKDKNKDKDFGIDYSKKIDEQRCRELIRSLVIANTRKSFRKMVKIENTDKEVDILSVTDRLLWAMCCSGKSSFKKNYEEIGEEELWVFLIELHKDYYKKVQTKNIVNSIEKQNVKVQPATIYTKDGRELVGMRLSNAEHKRKQYIFQFLKDFASEGEEGKQKLFLYFKSLVVLFYYGSERYEKLKETEISDWDFKLQDMDGDDCYSWDVMEKFNEKMQCADKLEEKKINQQIKELLKHCLHESYNNGRKYLEDRYLNKERKNKEAYEKGTYWLSYIEEKAEQLLIDKKKAGKHISKRYLCKYTWTEWISFICMKYVDMGKAVYHFAMPDFNHIHFMQDGMIGEVKPQYRDGVTSFDYEQIKAYENFDREVSMYITFAVNNFSCAVMTDKERAKSGKEDVLQSEQNKKGLRSDAVKRILQFFGGESNWENIEIKEEGKPPIKLLEYKKEHFYEDFRRELADVRNSSFHYTAVQEKRIPNPLIRTIFEQEYGRVGMLLRKKYYSNNVPMFYSVEKINQLMEYLYNSSQERPAQIPAFERILKRKDFAGFIHGHLSRQGKQKRDSMDLEDMKRFDSSLYFVLKEVYYYGFLQEKDLKELFLNSVRKYLQEKIFLANNNKSNKKMNVERWAAVNFDDRLEKIKEKNPNITFGEICQQIMTDYNMQNNQEIEVETGGNAFGNNKEKSYEHFPPILYQCIQNAFIEYLFQKEENKKVYDFLKTPEKRTKLAEEEFCRGWHAGIYHRVSDSKDSETLAWFTLAHFLNPRLLNRMIGTFRGHIQFLQDIDRRSQIVKRNKDIEQEKKDAERIRTYKKISEVLEFTLLFCGQMTNKLEDYFADETEYAKHLSKYVDFETEHIKDSAALKDFSERMSEKGSAIYHNPKNPILNKNVIRAMMYGNGKLLEACLKPISEDEIHDYYNTMHKMEHIFKNPQIILKKSEQKKMREFQNKKNRVELTNVTIYMEILDELMGQMISWAYLRERDLMYFQLGYYYIKLYYGTSIPQGDKRRCLKGEGFFISDGAILYQIAAMYTHSIPIYEIDSESGVAVPCEKKSTGSEVTKFVGVYGTAAYLEGLQLFMRRETQHKADKDNDENIVFRNYLDHFKYYSKLDRSIMDLYSVMFSQFFIYSSKLYRSVPIVFKNILARYFVIAHIDFCSKKICKFKLDKKEPEKERDIEAIILKDMPIKQNFRISKPQDNTDSDNTKLQSAGFTYKVKDKRGEKEVETKICLDARDKIFLQELERILLYSVKK